MKVSLISQLIRYLLINVLLINGKEGPITYSPTPNSIICEENKDYIDGTVLYENGVSVILDQMYYRYRYRMYNVYESDGSQEWVLKEFTKTNKDRKVERGRLMAGFYVQPKLINESDWKECMKKYEFNPEKPSLDVDPFEDYYTAVEFNRRFGSTQVIVFKDTFRTQYDYYHYKRKNEQLLCDDEQPNDGFVEDYNIGENASHGHIIGYHYAGKKFPTNGLINNLLLMPSDILPKTSRALPILYEPVTRLLCVIVNQQTANDVPKVYFNRLEYRQFNKTWKSLDLEKGYLYTGFVPLLEYDAGFFDERSEVKEFNYNLIAEPFRDKNSQERGPSYLFNVTFDEVEEDMYEPIITKWHNPGMDLFGCKFIPLKDRVIYYVFGVIISILGAILIVVFLFICVNNIFGRDRIVIVRGGRKSQSTPPDFVKTGPRKRVGAKPTADNWESTTKRSTVPSDAHNIPIKHKTSAENQ